MNRNRLSTQSDGIKSTACLNLDERISKLLSSPSNYEVQSDGKILIKSSGISLRGIGNVSVLVFTDFTQGTPLQI